MSPEHSSWKEVPKDNANVIRKILKRKDLRRLIHHGFLYKFGNGGLEISELDDVSDGVLADAAKASSSWYLVRGLNDSKRAINVRLADNKKWRDVTIENASKKGSKNRGKYRGKHRSDNKGSGLRAFFRIPSKRRK